MAHLGWIGVDLDGTLARYDKWVEWNSFGEPLAPMVRRIQAHLRAGETVKVFTARLNAVEDQVCLCRNSGVEFTNAMMRVAIGDWTEEHIGTRLEVTNIKDMHMILLYDDRAVQVEPNTGRLMGEVMHDRLDAKHAEFVAMRQGKP